MGKRRDKRVASEQASIKSSALDSLPIRGCTLLVSSMKIDAFSLPRNGSARPARPAQILTNMVAAVAVAEDGIESDCLYAVAGC